MYEEDLPKVAFDNVIYADNLKEELMSAFDELEIILSSHAGPFCDNAVIGSKWRQMNDIDEFTKDGIKILLHLVVSNDAVARFVARMTRFIGISVDKRCYDGTTTAMLLFCHLGRVAVEKMDADLFDKSAYEWSKDLYTLLTKALEYIEHLKITDQDLLDLCEEYKISTSIEEVRASMAYHMAMISSKGDDNLSSKIAQVIRSTPKHIYGTFRDNALVKETEEPYILKRQEYDLSVRANIGHIDHYNYKNDTQYLSEDAVVFMTGNDIVSNSMESSFLISFISTNPRYRADLKADFGVDKGWEELCEGKRNLIIVSTVMSDPLLIETIMTFNMTHPTCRISWFNMNIQGRMRTSVNKTFHAMSGAHLFPDVMSENALLSVVGLTGPKVKVHFIGNIMTFTGLYEKDGNVYHPFYSDPSAFEPYTLFCRETEEIIQEAMANITNQALDPDEVTILTSLYRSLICQDVYDIDIGGSAHDQYANRTVFEDAVGAALSAIREGIVLGGYGHLAHYFGDELFATDSQDEIGGMIFNSLINVLSVSLREETVDGLKFKILQDFTSKYDYLVTTTVPDENGDYNLSVGSLDKDSLSEFLGRTPGTPVLLQAYAGYNEQFKRFRDILPRLSNTSHLIDMRVQNADDVR
jgi:hypothetical protein